MLQKRRPTFNFANNLLQSLARRCDSPVPAIADMALAGLKDTIEGSSMNEHVKSCVTTLAVRYPPIARRKTNVASMNPSPRLPWDQSITLPACCRRGSADGLALMRQEVVKKKDRLVNPQVLQVFLSLRITSEMLSGPLKKKKLGTVPSETRSHTSHSPSLARIRTRIRLVPCRPQRVPFFYTHTPPPSHIHAHVHARTHARTRARAHTHTHTLTHTHTHTQPRGSRRRRRSRTSSRR